MLPKILALVMAAHVFLSVGIGRARAGDLEQGKSGDPVASLAVQSGWQPREQNPFLTLGQHRPLATWNDPCVLKHDGKLAEVRKTGRTRKFGIGLVTSRVRPGDRP